MYDHDFSNFGRPPVPDDLCKDSVPRHPLFWRRRFLKVFTIYGHGGHLSLWTAIILAIFCPPNLRRLHMKFEQHWPRGFRGGHLKFSTFFPYKCMVPIHMHREANLTSPIKGQMSMYNNYFSNFVDLSSLMICAKIQPQGTSVLEKKIFKGFYYIWAWWPSWSKERDHFSNLMFPQPKEAPYEI